MHTNSEKKKQKEKVKPPITQIFPIEFNLKISTIHHTLMKLNIKSLNMGVSVDAQGQNHNIHSSLI